MSLSVNLSQYTNIKLKITTTPRDTDGLINTGPLGQWLVTIEAYDSTNADLPIFVFQREIYTPADQSMNQDRPMFTNICSPSDLQEIDIGPLGSSNYNATLYRLPGIACLVHSLAEAQDLIGYIKDDVKKLVDHHKMLVAGLGDPAPVYVTYS